MDERAQADSPDGHSTQDEINRAVWESSAATFETGLGWLDRGEEMSILDVADCVRGQPILDLGVGAGRSASLLRLLTDDYLGIDYTPAMVEACRRRFPKDQFAFGDARDLSAYPTGHFGLVVFTFNGIDAVGHDDRRAILREVRRVLRPGGYFVFNTHNYEGPSFGDRPWNLRPLTPMPRRRVVYNVVRRVAELPFSTRNYFRLQASARDEGTHALRPSSSHRFGILVYFTTTRAQLDELHEAGFDEIEIYTDSDGERIESTVDTSGCVWLYFVARTPALTCAAPAV